MLATFCIDFAKITNRVELSTVVGNGLSKLGIDRYLLCLVSEDNATYRYHAFGSGSGSVCQEGSPDDPANGFLIAESLAEIVLNSPLPVAFAKDKVLKQKDTGAQNDFLLRSLGGNGLLGIALRAATRNIGIIWTPP